MTAPTTIRNEQRTVAATRATYTYERFEPAGRDPLGISPGGWNHIRDEVEVDVADYYGVWAIYIKAGGGYFNNIRKPATSTPLLNESGLKVLISALRRLGFDAPERHAGQMLAAAIAGIKTAPRGQAMAVP